MVCLCRAWCFCRLLSSYCCCRSSRRLRRLITGRRDTGTATASCRAINSPRITAFQLTPRKLRFRAWLAATGAFGISIQPQVITGTMATGTILAGPAFTVVATMAAASALAGRGRRSGRSGIAADTTTSMRSPERAGFELCRSGARGATPWHRRACLTFLLVTRERQPVSPLWPLPVLPAKRPPWCGPERFS